MRVSLEIEGIDTAIRALDDFGAAVRDERKKFLESAAQPVVEAAQRKAPVGTKIHRRYSTPKVNEEMRAPKGSGVVAATYRPGNLKKSVRVLKKLRRSPDVFVGPKMGRGNPDGYYAWMVEYGTENSAARPFMRPAAREAAPEVVKRVSDAVKLIARKKQKK